MRREARTVVVARTIADGKKYVAEHPNVPVNALVVVDARGLQGVVISELFWVDGWDLRRTPEARTLLETSALARTLAVA